jgi:hypothetical protein
MTYVNRIEGYSILVALCVPVARMFFNFEADLPQGDPSSPTIFSPRPISLGQLEQSTRNSGFDRMESIETFHWGSEGRSVKSETEKGGQDGGAFMNDTGGSEKPSGVIEVVRKSLHGWRKDSRG